jgi:hypothetical protein
MCVENYLLYKKINAIFECGDAIQNIENDIKEKQ